MGQIIAVKYFQQTCDVRNVKNVRYLPNSYSCSKQKSMFILVVIFSLKSYGHFMCKIINVCFLNIVYCDSTL